MLLWKNEEVLVTIRDSATLCVHRVSEKIFGPFWVARQSHQVLDVDVLAEVTYRYLLLLRESNIFTYETVYTREYFPQLHESVRRIVVTFLTEKSSLLITKR